MGSQFGISTAQRVEQAETNTLYSRLSAIRSQEGNPEQVYIESFGRAKAFIVKGIPDPYFNSVRGLTGDETDLLDSIIEFYREHGASCRFDIAPFAATPELLQKLAERGYYQSRFHASLYRVLPGTEVPSPPERDGLTVREIGEQEFSLFGEIYTKAFHMPEFLAPAVARNNRVLSGRAGWHFYLAAYADEPAAIAVLYMQDGAASLAAAATLPGCRGKGLHTALLAARIREAERACCDLVVGQAAFGSASQTNMERLGMRMAYTKSIWKSMH